MRVIVLAAGHGLGLDGYNKLLIKDPLNGKTVIENFREVFPSSQITVVVGYNAISIMNQYPELHYVYNESWSHTNNSYSLALALDDNPCFVVSSDIFIERATVERLQQAPADTVLTANRANRTLSSLNCIVAGEKISEIYQGNLRDPSNPEAVGVYKISSVPVLRKWKERCMQYTNLFAGQNLPIDSEFPIYSTSLNNDRFREVNTPLDYIKMLEEWHQAKG